MVNNKLKEEFITICRTEIKRNGIDELLLYLEQTDFYSAPASTRFHGNYAGGLVEHSLNVYKAAKQLANQHSQLSITAESIAIAALFHDLCKANFYVLSTRNVKDENTGIWHKEPFYKTDDQYPLGHGEKSVIILMKYLHLTDDEIYAIRFHMGGFDSAVKGGDGSMSKAFEICPFAVLLHLADMTATYLMEERIG